MRIRVIELADSSIGTVTPCLSDDEAPSEATILAALQSGQDTTPGFAGRPYVDVEVADLPNGTPEEWAIVGGAVVSA